MSTEFITCVGAVVTDADTVLAVRQAKGHPLEGQWTIPWGRIEPGESPVNAALRETREEAGVSADVIGLIGVQELPDPWAGSFALIFLCKPVSGKLAPDNRETDAADYFTLEQIAAFPEPFEPWSKWMVSRVLKGEHSLTLSAPDNPFDPHNGFL